MHPQAKHRMHQIVLEALDGLEVADNDLNTTATHSALRALTKFVEENFSDWVDAFLPFVDVFVSVEDAVRDLGLLSQPGPLKDVISPEQRQLVAQSVVEFWDAVPRNYEFLFPLPAVALFDTEIEIAPGVKIRSVPQTMVDYNSMGLGVPLNTIALAAPHPPVSCLTVIGKGLMIFASTSDPACAGAIRRAKTAVQLGEVEEVFESASTRFRPPQFVNYMPSKSNEAVALPAAFAGALARLTVKPIADPQPQSSLRERLATVGTILAREEQWDATKKRAPRGSAEATQAQFDRHCARIATAAEWLFDATHEQPSATTFVQTAIGFEALYGGAKGEPVIETLANRVAYSLGTSPQSREPLVQTFSEFYDTRSAVVHNGATRLT